MLLLPLLPLLLLLFSLLLFSLLLFLLLLFLLLYGALLLSLLLPPHLLAKPLSLSLGGARMLMTFRFAHKLDALSPQPAGPCGEWG